MHTNQLSSHFLTENLITDMSRMLTRKRFALETLLATGFKCLKLHAAKVLENDAIPDRIQSWAPLSLSVTSLTHCLALW